METTLVLLKPDAIQRCLIWQIISRFENKGLKIIWLKLMMLTEEMIYEHYDFLVDKPFFSKIKSYMTSAPVVALILAWTDAVKTVRNLTWSTNPSDAIPGSIRWDLALTIDANIIHASDSRETAQIEIKRFFKSEEVINYIHHNEKIIW